MGEWLGTPSYHPLAWFSHYYSHKSLRVGVVHQGSQVSSNSKTWTSDVLRCFESRFWHVLTHFLISWSCFFDLDVCLIPSDSIWFYLYIKNGCCYLVTCTFQLDARIKHMDPKWPRGCLGRFRIPGVQLLEIPYDPTTLSNEHAERINALDSQIAEKAGDVWDEKRTIDDREGLWRDLTWDENQQIQIDPAQ